MLFRFSDWLAFVGALLGLGGLVGLGQLLLRLGWDPADTRRIVHAGVGLFVAGTPLIFATPRPVYVLAAAFVVVNGVAKGRQWWRGIHGARPASWGTVLLPLAVLPALWATWSVSTDRLFILQVAFLVLALADPLASWFGQAFGRRELVEGATVAGSITFLGVAVVLAGSVLLGIAGWTPGRAVVGSLGVAVVATVIEAIGRGGWDNFFLVLGIILVLVPVHEDPSTILSMGLALAVGLGFGLAAYGGRALNASGAMGGGLFAACLVGLGGWHWALPGFVFFVLSSALSLVDGGVSSALTDGEDEGGRTLRQVLANGGVAWVLLGVYAVLPPGNGTIEAACYAGFLGALAAAAADTWATEIGVRTSARPWSLRTRSRVAAGTSGAVSLGGTVAAVLGAGSVAGAVLLSGSVFGSPPWLSAGAVLGAGLLGMTIDSVAGATVQARFREPDTGRLVEDPPDAESTPAQGWGRIDNETVNVIGTTTGAIVAILLALS